jgi:GxxExxY protein
LAVIVKNEYVASEITGEVIGSAMEVHTRLGPGFLESVYEQALAVELELKKIKYERQKSLPVFYRGRIIKNFTCDFFVDGQIIVELKALKEIAEIERLQVINYLKASGIEIGLLLNFGGQSLEYKRLINSKNKNHNNQFNHCNQFESAKSVIC